MLIKRVADGCKWVNRMGDGSVSRSDVSKSGQASTAATCDIPSCGSLLGLLERLFITNEKEK